MYCVGPWKQLIILGSKMLDWTVWNQAVIIIITYIIYKAPFPTGAHRILQLLTSFTMTKFIGATNALSQADITWSSYTHTHKHTNQYHVWKRQVSSADLKKVVDWENLISSGSVFQSVGAMPDKGRLPYGPMCWQMDCTVYDCGWLKLPGGHVDLMTWLIAWYIYICLAIHR